MELNFEKRYRLVREVIETIVLTLLMFLVINLAVQNFDVDGQSMETSLHNQERLMVDKWTYLFHPPARGDVDRVSRTTKSGRTKYRFCETYYRYPWRCSYHSWHNGYC